MTVQMKKTSTSTTNERAQQLFNKNIELEQKRKKSLQARVPSDPNTWHQIRENYEAIILEDRAFSEQHKIEFALWHLHYKRIEEFRAHLNAAQTSTRSSTISKNSGAPLQPDRITKIRVQFKAFLSESTEFYHDLIHKIRAKYDLPLGHFSEDLDNLAVVGNDVGNSSDVKKALVSCHRCLIYLGDIARYKGLYGEVESKAREYSAASSYYLQAASLWPSSGNPHHQLAILAAYSGDEMVTVYRYFRSLAAEVPISAAKDNLIFAFEKNRQSYTQLLEMTKTTPGKEVDLKEKHKDFCILFVRLHGILFSRTSLETFSAVRSSVTEALHELLSSGPEEKPNFGGDSTENGFAILRLSAILIFTLDNVNKKDEGQTYAEILQRNILFENACTVTFELMGLIIEECGKFHDPSSSFLLPAILVFLEWLACCPNIAACTIDENEINAVKMSFWKHCIALLNKFLSCHMISIDDDGDGDETCFNNMSRYEEGETDSRLALWEDFELRGFLPLLPAQNILAFSRKSALGLSGSNKERLTRVKRIIAAGKALASVVMVDQKVVSFNSHVKQFIIGIPPRMPENILRENPMSVKSQMMPENCHLTFEGEDEGEEIVFKPVLVEKSMEATGMMQNSIEVPEKGKTAFSVPSLRFPKVTSEHSMPTSDNTSLQVLPVADFRNSTCLTDLQASVADSIKNLGLMENGRASAANVRGSLMDTTMYSDYRRPPEGFIPSNMNAVVRPEVVAQNLGFLENGLVPASNVRGSLMGTAMYSNYMRPPEGFSPSSMNAAVRPEFGAQNLGVKLPPTISASFKNQGERPVRHLGPPPGFSNVPPKTANMPVSNVVGTNGSVKVDDYAWLDRFQPSSTNGFGPSYPTNQVSLGNTPFVSNSGTSIGHSGLPFYGMQRGNLNFYNEYQSSVNIQPNHGQKLFEQHHNAVGNQLRSQAENYQGQPSWTGNYRV